MLENYGIARVVVASKNDIEGIFHAADLIAWEWAKHIDRLRDGQPMRGSLRALIGPNAE